MGVEGLKDGYLGKGTCHQTDDPRLNTGTHRVGLVCKIRKDFFVCVLFLKFEVHTECSAFIHKGELGEDLVLP